MFRSFFSYLSKAAWARKIVTKWPISWKMASRLIAGENIADGIQTIKQLNNKGINATLDHLGEHTESSEQAKKATIDIIQAFQQFFHVGRSDCRPRHVVKDREDSLGVTAIDSLK